MYVGPKTTCLQNSNHTVEHDCCNAPSSLARHWNQLILSYRFGLDLIGGTVRDNKKAGVLEPAMSKVKSIKFATEAAITILRIDDMIKLSPEKRDENTYADALARGDL